MAPGVVRPAQARARERGRETGDGPARVTGVSPVKHPVGPQKQRLTFIQAELMTRPGPPTLDHETSGQRSTGWDHMSPGAPMAPALTHLLSKGPSWGRSTGLPWVAGPPAAVSKDPRSWLHLGPSSASDHSPALSTPLPVGVGVGSSQWPEGRASPAPRVLLDLPGPSWAPGGVGLIWAGGDQSP